MSTRPSKEDQYLNLAQINLGEALARIGNVRNMGGTIAENSYAEVQISLLRASAALMGCVFVPPINDPKHRDTLYKAPTVVEEDGVQLAPFVQEVVDEEPVLDPMKALENAGIMSKKKRFSRR
jgi:hypothetical protein